MESSGCFMSFMRFLEISWDFSSFMWNERFSLMEDGNVWLLSLMEYLSFEFWVLLTRKLALLDVIENLTVQ